MRQFGIQGYLAQDYSTVHLETNAYDYRFRAQQLDCWLFVEPWGATFASLVL